jgi:hypothetical protein
MNTSLDMYQNSQWKEKGFGHDILFYIFLMLSFFSLGYAFLVLLFSHYSFCIGCVFVFFLDCVLF